MAQFVAFEKGVEVNGQTVLAVVAGMGAFNRVALQILEKHGLKDIKPDNWYSQQAWLDSFKEIASEIGALTLFNIGKSIPDNADWPPFVKTIEDALASIDVAYHMNHRLGTRVLFDPQTGSMYEGIGHYGFEKTGDRKVKMVCRNPYPCDFDMGIIKQAATKFKPAGVSLISVDHDKTQPCRKNGQDACTYLVSW